MRSWGGQRTFAMSRLQKIRFQKLTHKGNVALKTSLLTDSKPKTIISQLTLGHGRQTKTSAFETSVPCGFCLLSPLPWTELSRKLTSHLGNGQNPTGLRNHLRVLVEQTLSGGSETFQLYSIKFMYQKSPICFGGTVLRQVTDMAPLRGGKENWCPPTRPPRDFLSPCDLTLELKTSTSHQR